MRSETIFYLHTGDQPQTQVVEQPGYTWLYVRQDGIEVCFSCSPVHIDLARRAQAAIAELVAAHSAPVAPTAEPLIIEPDPDTVVPF